MFFCLCNPSEDCHFHADCHDRDGDFYCECIVGFEGNGQICNDIDECVEGSSDRSGVKGRYDLDSSPSVCSGGVQKMKPPYVMFHINQYNQITNLLTSISE